MSSHGGLATCPVVKGRLSATTPVVLILELSTMLVDAFPGEQFTSRVVRISPLLVA